MPTNTFFLPNLRETQWKYVVIHTFMLPAERPAAYGGASRHPQRRHLGSESRRVTGAVPGRCALSKAGIQAAVGQTRAMRSDRPLTSAHTTQSSLGLRSSLRQKGQVVEYSSQARGCMGTRFAEADRNGSLRCG